MTFDSEPMNRKNYNDDDDDDDDDDNGVIYNY